MKKLTFMSVVLLLIFGLMLQGISGVAANIDNQELELGDVNGDSFVDNLDAAYILRYDAALLDLTDVQLMAGDVNSDDRVDNLDAYMILLYDAGINDSVTGNNAPSDAPDSSEMGSDVESSEVTEDESVDCSHINTEVKNRSDATISADGYSGDVYCNDCNQVIREGIVLDKFVVEEPIRYLTYTNSAGNKLTIPYGVDVLDYTLKRANKYAVSEYEAVEAEIFELINKERTNAGLEPLQNLPLAYYFSNLRANECLVSFSHTRPNGTSCFSVFDDENVFYRGVGENLVYSRGRDLSLLAESDVNAWMNSEGHRANILNPNFKYTTIAMVYVPETKLHYAVQLFFS